MKAPVERSDNDPIQSRRLEAELVATRDRKPRRIPEEPISQSQPSDVRVGWLEGDDLTTICAACGHFGLYHHVTGHCHPLRSSCYCEQFESDERNAAAAIERALRSALKERDWQRAKKALSSYVVTTAKAERDAELIIAVRNMVPPAFRSFTEAPITGETRKIILGKWAEEQLADARNIAELIFVGEPITELCGRFPSFFTEVFDRLPPRSQNIFVSDAARRRLTNEDLMHYVADVKGLNCTTLSGYRKRYRKTSGKARAARPRRGKTKPTL